MLACARLGADAQRGLRRLLRRARCAPGSTTPRPSCVITADGQYRRGNAGAAEGRRRRGRRGDDSTGRARAGGPPHRHRRRLDRRTDLWWHDTGRRPVRPARRRRRSPPSTRCSSSTPPAPPGSRRASCTPPAATSPRPPTPTTPCSTTSPATDVYWCTADIGWVTGHSYIVYGPLANRATQVIYEGTPNTPHEGRHWEIIDKYGVSIYYTAPTLIRTFMKWGADIPASTTSSRCGCWAASASRSTPRPGCGTGRHIGHDNCPIVDTWWQTETGAHHDLPAARA